MNRLPLPAAVLLMIAGMGLRDFLATLLVVAESSGHDRLAGVLDAAGDGAQLLCTVIGVDNITGLNGRSLVILAAMMVTSYNVTRRTTRWARKLRGEI